jgi:tRNA pseudouridine55 synthase
MMPDVDAMGLLVRFRSDDGGFLPVDKPAGWTSFDVVKKIRGALRVKKVGHAGTLDPMATGLLVLASQRSTSRIDEAQAGEKTYEGELTLGAVTPSYDADTAAQDPRPFDHVTREALERVCLSLTGEILQQPPMYSALKHKGRRLYDLARKGVTVDRPARPVSVYRFAITGVDLPRVRFEVRCSRGTYVRSLAHDLGLSLGCGAYLSALRRTAVGEFHVDRSLTVEQIVRLAPATIPMEAAA